MRQQLRFLSSACFGQPALAGFVACVLFGHRDEQKRHQQQADDSQQCLRPGGLGRHGDAGSRCAVVVDWKSGMQWWRDKETGRHGDKEPATSPFAIHLVPKSPCLPVTRSLRLRSLTSTSVTLPDFLIVLFGKGGQAQGAGGVVPTLGARRRTDRLSGHTRKLVQLAERAAK